MRGALSCDSEREEVRGASVTGPAAGVDWGAAAGGWMQRLRTGRVTGSPMGHSGRHAFFADSVDLT